MGFREALSDFGRSIDLTNPDSNLSRGTLAVTGTIYELADTVVLGALPNNIQGVQISNVGAQNNLAAQAAAGASQTVVNASAGLPAVGTNVGQGVGNLGYYGLQGVGAGLGGGLQSLFSGAGQGLGDLGGGLGKGLLLPVAIGVGAVAVLLFAASKSGTTRTVERVAVSRA